MWFIDLKEEFITFLSVLKKIKSMCKIKGEHAKNLSLGLDYGGTIALYAKGNILQRVLEGQQGNLYKEGLHFPESHNVSWNPKYVDVMKLQDFKLENVWKY